MVRVLLFLIGSYVFTRTIIPFFLSLLIDAQCLRKNYKGELIPVCMGLVFVPAITFNIFMYVVFIGTGNISELLILLVGALAMGLAGLLDDLLGNRSVTGLKGHLKAMLQGRLTTGGFKAAFGGVIALFISVLQGYNPLNIFINTLLVALFTNFINLLDLRPGRAAKGFSLGALFILFFTFSPVHHLFLIGLLGAVLAYFPYDLKATAMMGDAGSNILGISLGIASIYSGFTIRVVFLCFLIGIHLYAEKYSLTATIEKNRLLRYIDALGR
ncbi:UDP-N-acetylmuramyl pentapeptide phosphotransferase/UDP-N-acetylglucosamine-1-phosphate transferase [Anaerosolibacter carboniphilus]|uniref:UDP-N-acetylmuramyl pentapeptide phosphotransferase/UDP-N-acetylglucosamine-1-phosphate transferase n=1 Tax=Anaerosolibacter carboniphilus TaxID=1417629 RepID=A0A841KTA2_9FIRM|nr:glycosyl transferase [Anaerosolibacter carboniphilus]MBB6216647.1 UDP-N-acetylmuramyl pentapeptide phosphotransferase/UDP-N-acetylglucosamine-1-phosphate transferase [Anaerosolibacter carboniphilus]